MKFSQNVSIPTHRARKGVRIIQEKNKIFLLLLFGYQQMGKSNHDPKHF